MGNAKMTKKDWVNAMSFWAIAIFAVVNIVNGIIGLVSGSTASWWAVTSAILTFVADIFLILAVMAPAFRYAKTREHAFWKVLAYIFIILCFIAIILVFIAGLMAA